MAGKTKTRKPKVSRRRRAITLTKSIEKKHLDAFGTVTITQAGTLTLLTGVTSQGVQDTQRIGDSIIGRTLFVRFAYIGNSGSTYDNVRVIFFQDRQGYNAPTVLDVLEAFTVSSGFAPFSQYNHYLMSRFKILHDRTTTLREQSFHAFNFSISLKIMSKLEYVGASTFKNQVYMLLIGDNSNILTQPYCNYVSRFIYSDT